MPALFTILNFVAVFPLSAVVLEVLSVNKACPQLQNYHKRKENISHYRSAKLWVVSSLQVFCNSLL